MRYCDPLRSLIVESLNLIMYKPSAGSESNRSQCSLSIVFVRMFLSKPKIRNPPRTEFLDDSLDRVSFMVT